MEFTRPLPNGIPSQGVGEEPLVYLFGTLTMMVSPLSVTGATLEDGLVQPENNTTAIFVSVMLLSMKIGTLKQSSYLKINLPHDHLSQICCHNVW